LRETVKIWKQEVLTGYDQDERAFVIGHRDFKYTQIPARDGKAHGTIKRSNRYPNCSFFTHWTNLDDRISWPVEVDTSGDYAVELYYTCAPADVGSVIELSLGQSRVCGKITQAHDPPLLGAENDRVQRTESYVKDFLPLKLGTIHLHQGTGELVLRALSMPGSQVMDFRLLMLTRVDQD
jgi:hypothetical protein